MHPLRRRRVKLIRPGLQLKLIGWFAAVSVLSMLLEHLVLGQRLAELATALPDGSRLGGEIFPLLLHTLLLSLLVLVPLIFAIGVSITFRVAGPVHRLETYLAELAEGTATGPCRLRRGDELQQLCERVNAVAERLRAAEGAARLAESGHDEAPARAAG